ncbi:MAG: hypothetical protein K2P99_02240 [Burkholderiales bacterium]|nr:hypothetical protein [Burkholderiales bacterium]
MPNITTFTNNQSLPQFRLNKILAKLPQNTTLKTSEVYFINHKAELSNNSLNKLMTLIKCQLDNSIKLDSSNIIILPRLGTTSPWSSKATEILHRCGLTEIISIEKAIYYQSNTSLLDAINLLHDKMTESVIVDTNLIDSIFSKTFGKSYTEIDILTLGKSHLETINKQMGLALSPDEINYLYDNYTEM